MPLPEGDAAARYSVGTVDLCWFDAERCRQVPVRIYYPRDGAGSFPVIVFSHGLGGTREGCAYLGRHWARHGYVSVHPQHKGSDEDVWRGNLRARRDLRAAFESTHNHLARPRDVRFAVDRLEQMRDEGSALGAMLDLERLGVAGHGFGAQTALLVAGQVFVTPRREEIALADARVKAVVAMSAPVSPREAEAHNVYRAIDVPCMHMTGTDDDSPVGSTRAADRRVPFDTIRGADQYLITFRGGDHMIYPGHVLPRNGRCDPVFQRLIAAGSTTFWDAYLKGDSQARAALVGGRLDAALGPYATYETKRASELAARPR